MDFLLDTGRVSPKAFEAAFERVCRSGLYSVMLYLYKKNRASPESIKRAFECATSVEIVRLLYSKEPITHQCIPSVLLAAVQSGATGVIARGDYVEIVVFLRDEGCMPAELVVQAFTLAVRINNAPVVQIMCKEKYLTLEIKATAFVNAAIADHVAVVKIMRQKRCVSSEVMSQALIRAAAAGSTQVVDTILEMRSFPDAVIHGVITSACKNRGTVAQETAHLFGDNGRDFP